MAFRAWNEPVPTSVTTRGPAPRPRVAVPTALRFPRSGSRRIAVGAGRSETRRVRDLEQDAAATSPDQDRDGDTRLKRSVTGRLLFLFILGDVLGAGVYALVGEIAGE